MKFFAQMAPRFVKMRHAFEEALCAGVARHDVERICAILKDATDEVMEDGPEPRASTNGEAPDR